MAIDPNPSSKKPGNDARNFFADENLIKVIGAFDLIETHNEEQIDRKKKFIENFSSSLQSFQQLRKVYKYQKFNEPEPNKTEYQEKAKAFGKDLFDKFKFLPCPNTLHAMLDHSYYWIPDLATLSAEPLESGHKDLRDIIRRKSWKGDAQKSLEDALIYQFNSSSPLLWK